MLQLSGSLLRERRALDAAPGSFSHPELQQQHLSPAVASTLTQSLIVFALSLEAVKGTSPHPTDPSSPPAETFT